MKITSLKKIENTSLQYDIQTGSQNFFANGILVHNSMVTPVLVGPSKIKFKTKKSFNTKEADLADVLASRADRYRWVKKLLEDGFTPTFEVTSPRFPIVLKYEKDELTLLHVRENITGRYLTEQEIVALESPFPIVKNVIDEFSWVMAGEGVPTTREVRWDMLKHAAETREGIEGWVIQFDDGEMVKLKTKWYCDLHHAVTFTRWRDIARAICDDKADDLKGAFALTGRSIEPILKVEREIKMAIEEHKAFVDAVVLEARRDSCSPKDLALRMQGHELFGMIMRVFRGQDPDWMGWYVKNHLESDWGLEVVEVNV